MGETQYPQLEERLHDLVRANPGLRTEQVAAKLGEAADAAGGRLAWILADNFREADGAWYLRDRSLADQGAQEGAERRAISALECFLSDGPQTTDAVRKWYNRAVPDPPALSLESLLEAHFVEGTDGWRLPHRSEWSSREGGASPTAREVLQAFRRLARAILERLARPCSADEILHQAFPDGQSADWMRERDDAALAPSTPPHFLEASGLTEASSPGECARLILSRTRGIRRYDRDTFGLDDWSDEQHLLYHWPQMEQCVAAGREREFARRAAEIARMELPSVLSERVQATLPVYRRLAARGVALGAEE